MADDLDEDDLARLQELAEDAEYSTRLSQWEEEFMDDLRDRLKIYGASAWISDKQRAVLRRIEAKLYA